MVASTCQATYQACHTCLAYRLFRDQIFGCHKKSATTQLLCHWFFGHRRGEQIVRHACGTTVVCGESVRYAHLHEQHETSDVLARTIQKKTREARYLRGYHVYYPLLCPFSLSNSFSRAAPSNRQLFPSFFRQLFSSSAPSLSDPLLFLQITQVICFTDECSSHGAICFFPKSSPSPSSYLDPYVPFLQIQILINLFLSLGRESWSRLVKRSKQCGQSKDLAVIPRASAIESNEPASFITVSTLHTAVFVFLGFGVWILELYFDF